MRSRAPAKYRLVRPIAHGGMAEIWLAKQPWAGGVEREVVIKRVHPHLAQDPRFVSMFLEEVKLAAQLSHHNIVQVVDSGEMGGAYFLCMERLVGADLRAILHDCAAANRPLAPAVAATIVSSVCDGLDHAHSLQDERGRSYGIVHRDISPSNLFVTRQGVVKILDFGIAKVRDKAIQTEAGQLRGKVLYMSPEQASRSADLDLRSDLFSLGTVLYEALTGVQPFLREHQEASLAAVAACQVEPPSVHRRSLPPELDAIVMQAMQRERAARFQTAGEIRRALDAYLSADATIPVAEMLRQLMAEVSVPEHAAPGWPQPAGRTEAAGKGTSWTPWTPGRSSARDRSRRARVVAVAAAVLALAAGTAGTMRSSAEEPAPAPAPQAGPTPLPSPAPVPEEAAPPVDLPPVEPPAPPARSPRPEPRARTPEAHGYLSIQCKPYPCEVEIDGELRGETPLVDLQVPAGARTVRIMALVSRREDSRTIAIRPDERQEMIFDTQ